jgi:hypothetical protein
MKSIKVLPTLALSLVALTSFVDASYDDAQVRNLENRVSALEQRKGANGMINPPARPYIKDGVDLFVFGDLLFWRANENGLGYVIENKMSTSTLRDGRLKDPNFDWDFGYRVGLGYNIPRDGWDVTADWTHFSTTASNSELAPVGGALFPIWQSPDLNFASTNLTQASTFWRLRLNEIDLALGREFFVSKWLTLRPFMGLRTAWLRQKFNVTYTGTNIFGLTGAMSDKIQMKNRFWGIGLLGGLDTQWGLGAGFSIYGDLGLSMLRGHFRINQDETVQTLNTVLTHLRERLRATRVITDLALGLRWDQVFADCFRVMLQAGWEDHVFLGQNVLKNFIDSSMEGKYTEQNGDLALDGFTFELRLDF